VHRATYYDIAHVAYDEIGKITKHAVGLKNENCVTESENQINDKVTCAILLGMVSLVIWM